jgi:hypothetical protein
MEKRGHLARPRMTCRELRDRSRRLKAPPEPGSVSDRQHQCPTIRARPYIGEGLQTTPTVATRAGSATRRHDWRGDSGGPAFRSDPEAIEARRMKQLTRFQPATRQRLCTMSSEETVDDMPVLRETVRPEVEPNQLARRP